MSHSDNDGWPSGMPLSTSFLVQGRLVERRGSAVVRDETRQADADSHDEALRIAQVLGSVGFTVWIWAVDSRSVPAQWKLLERIDAPRRTADHQRLRERAARRGSSERAEAGAA